MNKYKIPNNFFDEMDIDEVLDFPEIPILYTLRNSKNNRIYLSYLDKFTDSNIEQRFVVHITNQELFNLKQSKIKIEGIFENSKENIFVLSVNQLNGDTVSSYKIPYNIFEKIFGKINAGYIFYDEFDISTEKQLLVKRNDPMSITNKIKSVQENLNLNILYRFKLNFSISEKLFEGVTNYA